MSQKKTKKNIKKNKKYYDSIDLNILDGNYKYKNKNKNKYNITDNDKLELYNKILKDMIMNMKI